LLEILKRQDIRGHSFLNENSEPWVRSLHLVNDMQGPPANRDAVCPCLAYEVRELDGDDVPRHRLFKGDARGGEDGLRSQERGSKPHTDEPGSEFMATAAFVR